MIYTKTEWVDGTTRIDAEKLNNIEVGIETVVDTINNLEIPDAVTIDSKLNLTSKNPVQNKVITAELKKKADTEEVNRQFEENKVDTSVLAKFADLLAAQNRITDLENTVSKLTVNSYTVSELSGSTNEATGDTKFTSAETVSGSTDNKVVKLTVNNGSAAVSDLTIENIALNVTADKNVMIDGLNSSGDLTVDNNHSVATSIQSTGDVRIIGTTLDQKCYNSIEIGLSSIPKSVTIDDCHFDICTNNAISVFDFKDNAEITIRNCTFKEVSNIVRISNKSNHRATINLINCHCDQWLEDSEYTGMFCLQDYTSTGDEFEQNKPFSKITINLINCTYGTESTPIKSICANKQDVVNAVVNRDYAHQLAYVYADKLGLVTDADQYPQFNIINN